MKLRIQRTRMIKDYNLKEIMYEGKNPRTVEVNDELQYWDDETGWNPVEIFEVSAKEDK